MDGNRAAWGLGGAENGEVDECRSTREGNEIRNPEPALPSATSALGVTIPGWVDRGASVF
jgi:hypothetical protein